MNINYENLDKLYQIYHICQEIYLSFDLYAVLKDNYPTDHDQTEKIILIKNALLDFCVVNWGKILGNLNDKMNIEKILQDIGVIPEDMKKEYLNALQYENDEYDRMWQNLKDWRDKIIAHLDYKDVIGKKISTCYFEKIPIQCKSIAFYIIKLFNDLYQCDKEFIFSADGKNYNLYEFSERMRRVWHEEALDKPYE